MPLFLSHFYTGNQSAMRKITWSRHAVDRFVHGSRAAPTVPPLLSHAHPLVFEIRSYGMKVLPRTNVIPSFKDILPSGICVAGVSLGRVVAAALACIKRAYKMNYLSCIL